MDGDSGGPVLYLLIAVIVLLLLGGCFFASAEIAYASVNKIKIKTMSDSGNSKAKKALYILNNADKALVCILIGNNIMHITCASITTLVATKLFGNAFVSLSTLIMTVIIFFFSEMLPKSYAKSHCEKVALSYAGILKVLIFLLTPLVVFFTFISNSISKIFTKGIQPTVTEDELQDIIETMDEQGSFENDETGDIVQNALEFDDVTAHNILTSRVDLCAIDVSFSNEKILEIIKNEKYSRLPVYENDIDNIIGILRVRSFLKEIIKDKNVDIKKIISKPFFVPESIKIDDLFNKMTYNKCYMAVVTDEFGGTLGIITIEDIVEEVVGDIWDESDEVIEKIVKINENTYRVSADAEVEDFYKEIGYDLPDEELERINFNSWCCELFESIPKNGETVYSEPLTITVEEADQNKILSLLIKIDEKNEGSEE